MKRDGSTMYANITCICAVHQARLLLFMTYVIVFTFNDFHRVNLPSLARGENSGMNNQLCVFPALDCREEERDHPTNYLPACIFLWASPGAVGDQEAAPGALISSRAKICCSGDFSEGCTFILKRHFYSSHQLCFDLLFDLQTPSLLSPLPAGCCASRRVLFPDRVLMAAAFKNKTEFVMRKCIRLVPPHLLTPWLARGTAAVPQSLLSLSHSLGGAFSRSTHLSPNQLTPSAGSAALLPPTQDSAHHGCSPSPWKPSSLCRAIPADLLSALSLCTVYSQRGCLFLITETPCRLYLRPGLSYFSSISVQVWRG